MVIKHKRVGDKGLFFVEQEEGNIIAEMSYTMPTEERMVINHTEVSDVLKGKNVGMQLVSTGVDFARKNNLKITPLCSFAKKVIDKHKEFQDVLA